MFALIYRIVSNCGPLSNYVPPPHPLLFQPRSMSRYAQTLYFSHLKQHNFINGTQNVQFCYIICCFLWYLLYFYPKYEFNVLVFLIMAPHQKLVFETIRYMINVVN